MQLKAMLIHDTLTNAYCMQWEKGLRHGKGHMKYSSKATYDGDWNNGRIHGYGTHTWADGSRYVGSWAHGTICLRYNILDQTILQYAHMYCCLILCIVGKT
jgi:MORN repeat